MSGFVSRAAEGSGPDAGASPTRPGFAPEQLSPQLPGEGVACWVVALSGGPDSSCLLAALAQLRDQGRLPGELCALHVHHGGAGEVAESFVRACEAICQRLEVDLQVHRHRGARPKDEAGLRDLRYAALASRLGPGDAALAAHHRRDQAETLLLRLMRGAGPRGLGGMAASRPLGRGLLLRPLLDVDPDALHAWAPGWLRGLWVRDPANASPDPDRNLLRAQVLPTLARRWKSAEATLAQAAALQREAALALDGLAQQDLRDCGLRRDEAGACFWLPPGPWGALPAPRRQNAVRALCRERGWAPPPQRCLAQDGCLQSPAGELRWRDWSGGQVLLQRRDWAGQPWLCLRLRPDPTPGAPQLPLRWDPRAQPRLELAEGVLSARPGTGPDALPLAEGSAWQVAAVGDHSRRRLADGLRLKKLFLRHRLADWARRAWPLVQDPASGQILAVPGLWRLDPAAPVPEEPESSAGESASQGAPEAPGFRLQWEFRPSPPDA